MIDTFQALAVVALAILPGACYIFAFERVAGSFGQNVADRLIRFLAASAALQVLFAGLTYYLYQKYVLTGRAARGELDWYWVWLAVAMYVLVPTCIGLFLGFGRLLKWRWVLWLTGTHLEPRAWDQTWNRPLTALLRIKLKSGSWIGGIFEVTEAGNRAYAAGYPHEGDLHLPRQVVLDPDTGRHQVENEEQPCQR